MIMTDLPIAGIHFSVALLSLYGSIAFRARSRPFLRNPSLATILLSLPGISRSGTTVVVALWLGTAGREAAAFSFLMAIPAIAGAAVLQIPDLTAGAGVGIGPLLAGGVAAAVTGILAIRTFLKLLDDQRFHAFSYYLAPLGLAFLAWLRWGGA